MKTRFPFFYKYFAQLKWLIMLCCTSLILQSLLAVVVPIPIKIILDKLIPLGNADANFEIPWVHISTTALSALAIMAVASLTLGLIVNLIENWEIILESKMVARLYSSVRAELLEKIVSRQQSYMDKKRKIDIVGRVSGDLNNVESMITSGIPAFVRGVPTLLFFVIAMLILNLKLTLILLATFPLIYWLTQYYTKELRADNKKFRRRVNAFEQEIHQAMSALALIKSLNSEDKLLRKLSEDNESITRAFNRTRHSQMMLSFTLSSTRNVIKAGLLSLGCWMIFQKMISLGDLFMFVYYLDGTARPINEITNFMSKYAKALVSMERVEELHQEMLAYPEVSGTEKLVSAKSLALQFAGVDFQYGQHEPLLKNFSASFPNNEMIALVGQSGSGKTSFIRLLNRLQEVRGGEILLNNKNVRDLETRHLRDLVRVISQESYLIAGTVRENLLLATGEDVSDEKLYEALARTNAADFVKRLPQGLDTMVGEAGQTLSGGQMRRVCIARAFVSTQAEIFVFDEPTTGLDPISADIVVGSIRLLAQEKSLVFCSTHNIQEIPYADAVLFFSRGSNPVLSTHENLSQGDAEYRSIVS